VPNPQRGKLFIFKEIITRIPAGWQTKLPPKGKFGKPDIKTAGFSTLNGRERECLLRAEVFR
jgi:hypothetical protein